MILKKRFEPLEHPSDVGITAFGESLKEAFENAAYGMFAIMSDPDKLKSKLSFDIKTKASDKEALLINWLNELIYLEDTNKVLLKEFKIDKISETELKARVFGEKIDPKRHLLERPVKAATFNQLMVKEEKGVWRARVVFDV